MLFSKIIEKKFAAVLGRYEGNPAVYEFSPRDFPEIGTEAFDIPGDRGILLKGAFYFYGSLDPDRLVVFDHGIFSGHLAYFREIECLAKQGYTVYSYDHTGCASTGGTGILGFAQGINDLDHVLTALQKDPRFAGKPRKLIGHSWGGYSAMNVAALHPEVSHVVSLAGFLSARALIEQYIPKAFLRYSEEVMDRERQHNPQYADMDARESMKKSTAKLMHLQSRDDKMVTWDRAYEPLSQALAGRADTVFVGLDHRNHDPHHTDRAVEAWEAMQQELDRLTKKKQLSNAQAQAEFRKARDWKLLTEQDPAIWEKIFRFLEV